MIEEHDAAMATVGVPATAKFTPHPQPEHPASAVDDDEMDGGCSTCNGLGLANVIDPSDCALVMDDCPECGGEGAAQSPAVSPPSVVAVAPKVEVSDEDVEWFRSQLRRVPSDGCLCDAVNWKEALESFAQRIAGNGERDAVDAAMYRWLRLYTVQRNAMAPTGWMSGVTLDRHCDAAIAQQSDKRGGA